MPFSQRTLDFLFENRLNDSKSWFTEHKAEYEEYLLMPFKEFTAALAPRIIEMDELAVFSRVSRIYRDARYARGSIFREDMWCVFSRVRDLYKALPAFYFDVSPKGFEYGCGYYVPSSDSMNNLRSLILSDSPYFTAAAEAYNNQDIFELYGDMYKKNRFPAESEEKCFWLNRKSIGLTAASSDRDILFSEGLPEKIAADFEKILPIYDLFMKAEELSAQPSAAGTEE